MHRLLTKSFKTHLDAAQRILKWSSSMRIALASSYFALAGCGNAPEQNAPLLEGVYKYPGCPDIVIYKNVIKAGVVEKPYNLINIKGRFYLDIDGTILYGSGNSCHLLYKLSSSSYIPLIQDGGSIRMEIFSEDLQYAIYYIGPS